MECAVCSLLTCVSGYYYSGCDNGSISDAACLPCDDLGMNVSLFSWEGDGCNFTCDDGAWFDGRVCARCSELECAPGTYLNNCTRTQDTGCLLCEDQDVRKIWTQGCDYSCASGFWRNGTDCVPCSNLSCMPGMYADGCGGTNDASCFNCTSVGSVVWINACAFECEAGSYAVSDGCAVCSDILCDPGQRVQSCNTVRDTTCVMCDSNGRNDFVWSGGECNFECVDGFWRNGTMCESCSALECGLGFQPGGCGGSGDTQCILCEDPSGEFEWTDGFCGFTCLDGYFKANISACVECSDVTCYLGEYKLDCTPEYDGRCIPCYNDNDASTFIWTEGCGFECVGGYWMRDGSCEICSNITCDSGFHVVGCLDGRDSECGACQPPLGEYEWGSECNFTCASGFFKQDEGLCAECSVPECGPGTHASNCTPWSDSVCVSCGTSDGSFLWTRLCEYECANGFFMERGVCVPCSESLRCPPGFTEGPCGGSVDTQCVPCADAGPGSLWTFECRFVCGAGYFKTNGGCVACNSAPCVAGTYRVECDAFADAMCLSCQAPMGSYRWTDGCDFECLDGYFLSGIGCIECSVPECDAGTHASNCTRDMDAQCVDCMLPTLNSDRMSWTRECEFECNAGFFRTSEGCSQCTYSGASCLPGTYSMPCALDHNAYCGKCSDVVGGPFVWLGGCDFVCMDGFFQKNASACARCSVVTCAPGWLPAPCSTKADASCVACPRTDGMVFVDGCVFRCEEGFFRDRTLPSSCKRCALDLACDAGSVPSACSSDSDSVCQPCPSPSGPFVWLSGCVFQCAAGFVANETTGCYPAPPLVYTVVETAMTMQNTVNELCVDMFTLLGALSAALGAATKTAFVTNVTTLDGETCVANQCPQCGLVTSSRRLLANGVSLMTSSTSVEPVQTVDTSTPPLATPASDLLLQAFVAVLSNVSTLAVGGLTAEAKVSVVYIDAASSTPRPVVQDMTGFQTNEHAEVVYSAVFVGVFTVMVLVYLAGMPCRVRQSSAAPAASFMRVRIDEKGVRMRD